MRKSFLIAFFNLRRARSQTAAIIVLLFLASAMLNLWLMLSMDYKKNFDRYHEKLNAEHVTLAVSSADEGLRDFIAETLEKDSRVTEYDLDDALNMVGSFGYNGGEINTQFVILEKEAALNRPVGRIEILEEGEAAGGLYLPMLYKNDGDLAPDQTITLKIGSAEVDYPVCGFFNSIMAGSHNCSMCALVLTPEYYEELEEQEVAPASTLVSVRIREKEESEEFETWLKNVIAGRYPGLQAVSNSYSLVSSSRYISQMICSGIVSAMAFFVTVIAMVVIASNVINDIQENMRSLGVMKAIGYTSRQIEASLQLQFAGIALATAAAGIGLSYILFPAVNAMMITQTGIPYAMHFLPLPSGITLGIVGGTVSLAVRLSSGRIRKIDPIAALRQGVMTHSFKQNHIPLEKTNMPLQLALALKTTCSGVKQNITVCITMLVLSLVVVFAGLMVENVIVDMEPFINLIVGETADSCINVNTEAEEKLLSLMEAHPSVEKAYLFHSETVAHKDEEGNLLIATISEDFSRINNQNICFQGRLPLYENEIAVGAKYAGEKNLKIGDEITLTAKGRDADYIICGFTQMSNNLGKDCLLTRSGFQRMGNLDNVSYYINVADGADVDAFQNEIGGQLGGNVNASVNISSVVNGSASVYVSLMAIIVAAVLCLSGIIIVFVLYLLVRTLLNGKKRDYGILKALGFSTGQLVVQTAMSFMPTVICSAAVGLTVCAGIINPLTALFLGGIGIVKCTFTVPVGFIAAAGMGVVLFAFGTACLLSLRIRRIVPVTLLAGE